jgi:hypothetical protein
LPDPFSPENDDLNKCAQFANGIKPFKPEEWLDFNVDLGFLSPGVYAGNKGDWHTYLGVGWFTPGFGVYVTPPPTHGWGWTVSGSAYGLGSVLNYDSSGFSHEQGGAWPGWGAGRVYTW